MLDKDKSSLYSPELSKEENDRNLKIRKQVFVDNYELILKEVKRNGFPDVREEAKKTDSCQYYAIFATFIHISQTRPELLFNDEIIHLLTEEIEQGRLDNSILFTAVKMRSFEKVCDSLRLNIEKSVSSWQLDTSLLSRFTYVPCLD